MPSFDANAFEQFILDEGVVGFFDKPLKLKSGRTSHWYVNWRRVTNDVYLLDRLCDYVIDFVDSLGFPVDTIYGVPEGATKTGVIAQTKWAKRMPNYGSGSHVLSMGRAKPKLHGDPNDRYFVGTPKGSTLVLEDVTTTGGSLVATLDQLDESGISIAGAVGLTNRWEKPLNSDEGNSVGERIEKRFGGKIKYYSMSSADSLLPKVIQKLQPSSEIVQSLQAEYEDYGVTPLKLS